MLGVNATTDSYRFNESRTGAEHWVGGILGFAHPGVSKTHTRSGGVISLAVNQQADEDDI
jgi:hypothetical protein